MTVVKPTESIKNANLEFTRAAPANSAACYMDYFGRYKQAGINEIRFNHRYLDSTYPPVYDALGNLLEIVAFEGPLIEPQRTNYWTNNSTFDGTEYSTPSVPTELPVTNIKTITPPSTALVFVFSFYGTGSVNVRYNYTVGTTTYMVNETLVGTGINDRVWKTFFRAGAVTFTVTDVVNRPQVEVLTSTDAIVPTGMTAEEFLLANAQPTSWIPCTVTDTPAVRAAETLNTSGITKNSFTETVLAYDIDLPYTAGAYVDYNYNIYEAIVDAPIGTPPTELEGDLIWNFVRPSNKLAMIDLTTDGSSKISDFGYFSYVAKSSDIDFAAMVQLSANVTDLCIMHCTSLGTISSFNHSELLTQEYLSVEVVSSLKDKAIADNYYSVVSFRISPPIARETTGTVILPAPEVSVGEFTYGESHIIGDTLYGVSSSIVDYSIKKTNTFGTTSFVKRGFSKRVSGDVMINRADQNTVLKLLYSLRAVPALWIASDNEFDSTPTIVFGFYNSFNLKIQYPTISSYNIEIEGIVL
jgi:hypothetical protein